MYNFGVITDYRGIKEYVPLKYVLSFFFTFLFFSVSITKACLK